MLASCIFQTFTANNTAMLVNYRITMAKRKLDKISIHDVKTYDSAIEHGMITELSPVKKAKKMRT